MGRVSECCHRRVSFLPLKENIPNFKMKLFFVLALVVMSFGGLNAAVIPEEMEFSAAKGDILTDDQIARVILEVIAKSEAYGIMDIVTHLPGLIADLKPILMKYASIIMDSSLSISEKVMPSGPTPKTACCPLSRSSEKWQRRKS